MIGTGQLRILMVRHGRTDWNDEGRIQGHTDIPLNESGRRQVLERRVPAAYGGWPWQASPLCRAQETARLLGATRVETDVRLREMNWGRWEGRTRANLRAEYGERMAAMEAAGPDFRPPGGESPRELQARLLDWARDAASRMPAVIAVTHKGVIKAALGLAEDWDLTGKAPRRLRWECAHLFRFDAGTGRLHTVEVNVGLDP
jgi:probable phosphoglycerate mutase